MEFVTHDFRHAQEILDSRDAWSELLQVVRSIERDDVLRMHHAFGASGKRMPAGGQTALNALFRELLAPLGWINEPRLFRATEADLRKWKMDFLKSGIGLEVSFNHAEAIAWTFTRLNIAGESERVIDEHRIDVGVAFFATDSLKAWAKMDSAVGTFEVARVWLGIMRPIMPIPILVIGLSADDWAPTDAFRGTSKGTRGGRAVGVVRPT